jgi:hypothetical protein
MPMMQRRKGKVFEREIASTLRAVFPLATVHRSSQADRAYHPDVVVDGNAPLLARCLWLELQDARAPTPLDKLAQAERDCERLSQTLFRIPVVVWHKYRERSVQATLRLDALMVLTGSPFQPVEFAGIPVTVDWEQLLDVLRRLSVDEPEKAKEAA